MAVTRYLLNNNHIPAVTQAAVWGIMAEAQALLAIKDHDVFISRYPPLREKFYIFVYPFMRGVDLPSEYVSRRILMGKMLHRRLGVAGMRVNVIEEDEKITLLLEGVFQPEKHMRNISCRQSGIEQAL